MTATCEWNISTSLLVTLELTYNNPGSNNSIGACVIHFLV